LQEALAAAGHEVCLEQIAIAGRLRVGTSDIPLASAPATEGYDALVFACPVHGGMPASAITSYLDRIPSLQDKRVACLVTGFFPAEWGSNQALAQMAASCEAKGATVCGSASVCWFSLRRKRRVAEAVDNLRGSFQGPDLDAGMALSLL
jgi:NAD(P)H-dependent FMN reductase